MRIFRNQSDETIIETKHSNVIQIDSSNYTITYVPGVKYRHHKAEFDNYYNINNEGIRENETYLDKPRDTSKIRILAIGDSFTYGEGSELEDVWHSLLERYVKAKGKNLEVINAGVGAHDQYQEYYYLKKIIGKYKPDYVLLGFLPNDLTSNKFVNQKIWPSNVKPKEAKVKPYVWLMDHYQTLAFARRLLLLNKPTTRKRYANLEYFDYFKSPQKRPAIINNQFEVTGILLNQIDSICKAHHAPFIVVYIPHIYEIIADKKPGIDLFTMEHFLAAESRKTGFYFIPTLTYFRQQSEAGAQTHFYEDEHLTEVGNRILADAIKDSLVKILEK